MVTSPTTSNIWLVAWWPWWVELSCGLSQSHIGPFIISQYSLSLTNMGSALKLLILHFTLCSVVIVLASRARLLAWDAHQNINRTHIHFVTSVLCFKSIEYLLREEAIVSSTNMFLFEIHGFHVTAVTRADLQHGELPHTAPPLCDRHQIGSIYPPAACGCSSNDSDQPPSSSAPAWLTESFGFMFPQISWDQRTVLANVIFRGLKVIIPLRWFSEG